MTDSVGVASMVDIFFHLLQGGRIDVGFLQGSQIDRFGNINTTVIGDYAKPAVRLPGSGGACEIAILARRVLVVAPQDRRSFPERVDFMTSPGFLDGGDARVDFEISGLYDTTAAFNAYAFELSSNTGENSIELTNRLTGDGQSGYSINTTAVAAVVPVPASVLLFFAGLGCLLATRRRSAA